jgi:hypothetical protein
MLFAPIDGPALSLIHPPDAILLAPTLIETFPEVAVPGAEVLFSEPFTGLVSISILPELPLDGTPVLMVILPELFSESAV